MEFCQVPNPPAHWIDGHELFGIPVPFAWCQLTERAQNRARRYCWFWKCDNHHIPVSESGTDQAGGQGFAYGLYGLIGLFQKINQARDPDSVGFAGPEIPYQVQVYDPGNQPYQPRVDVVVQVQNRMPVIDEAL